MDKAKIFDVSQSEETDANFFRNTNQSWARLILHGAHPSEHAHIETNGVLSRSSNRRCLKKSS